MLRKLSDFDQDHTDTLGGLYEGSIKNEQREGQGKMTYEQGAVYEGAWMNDRREGQGKMSYANGNIYVGAW